MGMKIHLETRKIKQIFEKSDISLKILNVNIYMSKFLGFLSIEVKYVCKSKKNKKKSLLWV